MCARTALTLGLLGWSVIAYDAGAQSAAGSGRLSGIVLSTSATAIADATISLSRIGAGESPTTVTTTSDRQGGFGFDRVAAGRYRLSASKAGYTNRQPVRSSAQQFDTGLELTVSNNQHVARIQLTLHREASIAGRVAEPDGIPAPDVQVFAAVRRGNGHARLEDTRTVAAWDGRYRITGLPPGEYLLVILPGAATDPNRMRVNAERRAPESSSATRPIFETTFYPGVTAIESAETVTVFEGIPVDGIDTWLIPGERHSISGRVLWPEGVTAENIIIEYANLTARRSGLWTVPEPGDLFRISGVPRGTVVLLARADSNRGPLAGVVMTEVNVDEIDDLELRLDLPGTVEGRVAYEPDIPPSARTTRLTLKQRLLPVSPLYPEPESAVATDGRFRVTNTLGLYEFDVQGYRIVRVTQSGRAMPGGRIRVAHGETITDVQVTVTK
jgi:hypothetical protein